MIVSLLAGRLTPSLMKLCRRDYRKQNIEYSTLVDISDDGDF